MTTALTKTYIVRGQKYVYFRPSEAMQLAGLKSRRIQAASESFVREAIRLEQRRAAEQALADRPLYHAHLKEIYRKARDRAARKGIAFEIALPDIDRALSDACYRCSVTGIPFSLSKKREAYRSPYRPSIDRIDARRGYVAGNIRLVCVAVNTAMADWGDDVFWQIVTQARRQRRRDIQRTAVSTEIA